ncbi:MAG: TIGR03960 family B12-binding radical SAM protein [Thermodesulfobacteriota bacterium]
MKNRQLQQILPFLEHPSRYLGTEINARRKKGSDAVLHIALAFPDLYEIGTSHFGMQILYHILNASPDIIAERVFMPAPDMIGYLKQEQIPLMTLESKRPICRFDIIGFSLLYELNYTNLLAMLDLGKIPFYSRERSEEHPFVIAGGPCTCNPEPMADFFDAMVIGDGEKTLMAMATLWMEWKREGKKQKELLLNRWSGIEGVYVPNEFRVRYDPNRFQILEKSSSYHGDDKKKIIRAIVSTLDDSDFPKHPVVPFGKPVHDRLRLEIARGCTRGCRFCQAGMIYRPVRERSPESLLRISELSLTSTGYDDLSLLSLSTGDYACIQPLMDVLMGRCESRKVAVSFPSLRADTLTPGLMNQIKRVRKTGFTIAPEAGSERLRKIINKNLNDSEILETVQSAFDLGWQVVKLYFMVGLPFETDEDLNAMIDLIKELRRLNSGGRRRRGGVHPRGTLNVSIATFIPKPHTPFQWASQISISEAKEKIGFLKKELKLSGIQIKWQNPEVSMIEGLWARGDRSLSGLLVNAYRRGAIFDGWSDRFDFGKWRDAVSETGIDLDFFTQRKRQLSEPLPWDHIDVRVSKAYLIEEWNRAQEGGVTQDCRHGDCNLCGSCDFETIQPIVFKPCPSQDQDSKDDQGPSPQSQEPARPFKLYRILYSKKEEARFFGHLEMVRLITQGMRRAEIPLRYSEGFHPKPKISFDDPLPLGMESEGEFFYFWGTEGLPLVETLERLNRQMPTGLHLLDLKIMDEEEKVLRPALLSYRILLEEDFDENAVSEFNKSESVLMIRKNRKGGLKEFDLKDIIKEMKQLAPNRLFLSILNDPGKTIRPAEILSAVFKLPEHAIRQARIVKQFESVSHV